MHVCCHVHQDTFLLCYVVWTCTFDSYVRHDIMQVFPFMRHPTTCNALSPTMVGPRGTYMSLLDQFICAYVGRVRGSITYPILPGTWKSPRSCDSFKIGLNHVMCVIVLLTPTVWWLTQYLWLTWYFLKYSSPMLLSYF